MQYFAYLISTSPRSSRTSSVNRINATRDAFFVATKQIVAKCRFLTSLRIQKKKLGATRATTNGLGRNHDRGAACENRRRKNWINVRHRRPGAASPDCKCLDKWNTRYKIWLILFQFLIQYLNISKSLEIKKFKKKSGKYENRVKSG